MPIGMRGGSAPGERRGGRKSGSISRKVVVKHQNAVEGIMLAKAENRTPLQFLLGVQNAAAWVAEIPDEQLARRTTAAIAAAPYCHARLAAVAIKEVPDANAERRKSMLAGLNYQQRQAIAGILAAAALGDDEAQDVPVVVESSEESK
jgi:hypothetical protein